MSIRTSKIVDERGRPFHVVDADSMALLMQQPSRVHANYDAAQTTDEFQNWWANADRLDADSAHSREVRHTLISRSRYETGNNGYSDGIAQTYATDMVGRGPTLRMQTSSPKFNQLVEYTWSQWAKRVQLRRKLWCMAHAKHVDGEAFAVMRRNPRLRHQIKLDLVLYEAEQVQTPYLPFDNSGYVDGIEFDEFGNPTFYDVLRQHPGTHRGVMLDLVPERVPADRMLHWFKLRRPGQHRAVPEMASTLNTGAAARRWREATIAAAETAASFALMLHTAMNPDGDADEVAPMSTFDIKKRMMTALPMGWQGSQLKAEHPNAQYESFHKTLVNEQARPKSMPLNKAACNSADYNYASGRLDHQTYYGATDIDREDCVDLTLDPLFDVWFDLAVAAFGWLGGDPRLIGDGARSHQWDWPKHPVADIKSEATANATRLQSGQVGLHQIYSEAGLDLEDEIPAMALTFGVTEDDIRRRLLDVILPAATQPVSDTPASNATGGTNGNNSAQASLDNLVRLLSERAKSLPTNGHSKQNGDAAHA